MPIPKPHRTTKRNIRIEREGTNTEPYERAETEMIFSENVDVITGGYDTETPDIP